MYGQKCDLGFDVPHCVFNNPLALSPRSPPSALQCLRSADGDTRGTCRIGPNKHGDACNQPGECASGNCIKELRICKGIDEGETCEPTFPDPCQPDHFCLPGATGVGRCQKVASPGRNCFHSEGCARGFYCAGQDTTSRKCVAPFSVPDGTNTTVGPYMCASANAVLVQRSPSSPGDNIFTCIASNSTRVGELCSANVAPPSGYECVCSRKDGVSALRLRTVDKLGLGGRSAVWRDLFTCLMTATSIMGDACEFDSEDLEIVRYGSCAYYACYPRYLKLVNATGGREFTPPLDMFEPFAQCEWDAAKDYYKRVASTECLSLPYMENWRCAVDSGPLSLSVANTSGVIAFIFLAFFLMYIGHAYYYRKENGTKIWGVKN